MKPKNTVEWVVWVLLVVGALNWGLVGAANFNLVDTVFGAGSLLAKVVYVVVGLAALYALYGAFAEKE